MFETVSPAIRREVIATIAVFIVFSALSLGCGSKESDTSASTSTTVQPVPGQPGAPKPTAEQEEARKRGEAMGPAIQAANEAAQKGN